MAVALGLGLGLDSVIPVLGAAILLPAAGEATLRLHSHRDNTDPPMTVTPDVDDLLQRVMEQDLDMRADLDLELLREISRTTTSDSDDDQSQGQGQGSQGPLDTWSVVWYCGMFAAFTSLFLIMPCSQVLCRSGLLHAHSDPRLRSRTALGAFPSPSGYGTPPPPYKQFAPPSYEDVILDLQPPGKAVPVSSDEKQEKDAGVVLDVYVIPLRPESAAVARPPVTEAVA